MQGFIGRRIPLFLRRALTMLPGPGRARRSACRPPASLVISQVVLSFGIPFALVPLVLLTAPGRHHGRAGEPAARPPLAAAGVAALIIALNACLLATRCCEDQHAISPP